MNERVAVGRIVRAHGVSGEVVVRTLSDVRRWRKGDQFALSFDRTPRPVRGTAPIPESLTTISVRENGDFLVIQFQEITDRDQAQRVSGGYLEVSERASLPGKWLFYNDDLLGFTAKGPGLGMKGSRTSSEHGSPSLGTTAAAAHSKSGGDKLGSVKVETSTSARTDLNKDSKFTQKGSGNIE